MTIRAVPTLLETLPAMLDEARAAGRVPLKWHIASRASPPLCAEAQASGAWERRPGGDLLLGMPTNVGTPPDGKVIVLICAGD